MAQTAVLLGHQMTPQNRYSCRIIGPVVITLVSMPFATGIGSAIFVMLIYGGLSNAFFANIASQSRLGFAVGIILTPLWGTVLYLLIRINTESYDVGHWAWAVFTVNAVNCLWAAFFSEWRAQPPG